MEKEQLYEKIQLLKKEYLTAKVGRRTIQTDILKTIDELRKCTDEYNNELHKMEMYYKYRDYYISDYRLVMNVILKLANENEEIYSMKEMTTTDFVKIDDNEVKQVYGKFLVITNKDILDSINENDILYYDEFSHMASRIIDNGHSMVIVAPYYFEGSIKPKDYLSNVLRVDIKNFGIMSNISCYLQGGEIEKIVYQILDYIDINGADFQNIDENTLCDLIRKSNNNKVLLKK